MQIRSGEMADSGLSAWAFLFNNGGICDPSDTANGLSRCREANTVEYDVARNASEMQHNEATF